MLEASARRILQELGSDDVVLDIGGWADPFWRSDWVMDLAPHETRGLYSRKGWVRGDGTGTHERFDESRWIQRDICDREPYPFDDGEIDFVICAHTLEDVRDPDWVCSEMVRIAKRGYIEVPSRLVEQTFGLEGAWAGWGHHRWICEVDGNGIEFVFKWPGLHTRPSAVFPPELERGLNDDERVQMLWWDNSFSHRERIFLEFDEMQAYLEEFVSRTEAARPVPGRGVAARLRRRAKASVAPVVRAQGERSTALRLRRTLGAASCVTQPTRFVAAELSGSSSERRYRLRGSGLSAQVRHPLLDMWILEEVFRNRVYQPPPEALRALQALHRPARVVDLGGHVGYFALFMLDLLPGSMVVSLEPDPANAASLRRSIESNGLHDSWNLVEACATTSDGELEFESSFHLSRIARQDTALADFQSHLASEIPFLEGTPLLETQPRRVQSRDAFAYLPEGDLLKIDIEGGEWDILDDPRFASLEPAAVVLEYHPPYYQHADPESVVRRALESAGLDSGPSVPGDGAAVMWAWRRSVAR